MTPDEHARAEQRAEAIVAISKPDSLQREPAWVHGFIGGANWATAFERARLLALLDSEETVEQIARTLNPEAHIGYENPLYRALATSHRGRAEDSARAVLAVVKEVLGK